MRYLVILLFCFGFAKAQETAIDTIRYECRYTMSYQQDSTNIYSKNEENVLLQIGKEKSLFVTENAYKSDSIKNYYISNNILSLNMSAVPKSAFYYRIVKDIHKKTAHFYDKLFRTALSYEENVNLDWKLTNETEKIAQLDCKIAYVDYAGRRYKTWYSTEIAIPEGPYKFYGLPGLIVKMEDTRGYYKFELISFKDISDKKKPMLLETELLKSKKATKKDFVSAQKNHIANLGQVLANSGFKLGQDAIKMVQDREKRKNNPIELKP